MIRLLMGPARCIPPFGLTDCWRGERCFELQLISICTRGTCGRETQSVAEKRKSFSLGISVFRKFDVIYFCEKEKKKRKSMSSFKFGCKNKFYCRLYSWTSVNVVAVIIITVLYAIIRHSPPSSHPSLLSHSPLCAACHTRRVSHTLANTTQWSACLFSPNDLLAEIFLLFSYGFLATTPPSRIAFPYSSREMENFQIQIYVFACGGMTDDCETDCKLICGGDWTWLGVGIFVV